MTLRHPPTAADLGLLLVGHGTRDTEGLGEFRQLAESFAQAATRVAVEVCFLELAEPTIQQGIARLMERGVRRVIVLPLLLFSAGHAQRDIPQAVRAALEALAKGQASRRNGSLPDRIWQAPVLACHPDIIELSARRYIDAVTRADSAALADGMNRTGIPAAKTLLLMVGRGSNAAEANAEFVRFAQSRCEQVPVGELQTCFVAMARPTLDEGLRMAGSRPFERIVVQPHLLFPGELLHGIRAAVGAARQRAPDRQWIVTEPLGADGLLVRALLSRAGLEGALESDSNELQTTASSNATVHPFLVESVGLRADLALPEPNV